MWRQKCLKFEAENAKLLRLNLPPNEYEKRVMALVRRLRI